jgi:hypothetical protein
MRYKTICVLVVCAVLLGVSCQCRAQDSVRVSEVSTRIEFRSNNATILLPVENISRGKITAHISVQLIDPEGAVRAQGQSTETLSPGGNKTRISVALAAPLEKNQGPDDFFWYRLRYSVEAKSASGTALVPAEGTLSVSEAAPQFFELHAAAPTLVKGGSRYAIRVRAIHPVTSRPAPDVMVQASVTGKADDAEPMLTGKAVTDARGFATLEFTLPEKIDPDGIDIEVTGTRGGFTVTADDDLQSVNPAVASLSTDKPLYQPGQSLHMRVLAFDDNKKSLAGQVLNLEIKDPEETLVYRATATTSRYGIASADWQIPGNLRLGKYEIHAKFQDSRYENIRAFAWVKISRYELPTFMVAAKPDRDYYQPGQNADIEIRADYLYGEPVRRGHVRIVHETERKWNYREQRWDVKAAESYEGDTDAQGHFVAHVDLSKDHDGLEAQEAPGRFSNASFSAYFTDAATGRTEERRFDLRLTHDPIHVYLISGPNGVGYPQQFYLSTNYADGTPASCEVQITWATNHSSEGSKPAAEVEQLLRRVRTNRYGVAKVSGLNIPDVRGHSGADLRFVAKDSKGALGHQVERIWNSYETNYYLSRHHDSNLLVSTDKALYQQGEPIEVQLSSNESEGVVTVEAYHDSALVASSSVRLHQGRASLEIPANDKFQNEVTLEAFAFGTHTSGSTSDSDYGGTHTVLFPKNHELNLDVRFGRASYQPGENASANVRLTGPNGDEVHGAIGLAVVDKAVEERQRTDRDLSDEGYFGFYGTYELPDELGGVSRRDLEKLDLSKPLPDGLDLVAEILLQQRWSPLPRFFDSGSSGDIASVFASSINPQMKLIKAALDRHYQEKAEYPKTEAMLRKYLSEEGINFDDARDPWGMPYFARIRVEGAMDVLNIVTAGPDKKVDTEDDRGLLEMEWPYFKPYSMVIDRAVHEFHKREGGYIRDARTLEGELSRSGIDFDSLRDPWGTPYKLTFGITQSRYTVEVTSAGPDRHFRAGDNDAYDDFILASIGIDYFEDTRIQIDNALEEYFRQTKTIPQDLELFRTALKNAGIDWDALRDPWGHPYYTLFRQQTGYSDDIVVENNQEYQGTISKRKVITPVTKTLNWIYLRSAGPDGAEGTPDDFGVAAFARSIRKQSSHDAEPVPAVGQPVLTGYRGAIMGVVLDPDGKAVIGAEVVARNTDTQEAAAVTSGDGGEYVLRNLAVGHYVVTVSFSNFRTSTVTNVPVISSGTTTVNVTLEVGESLVTVEVSAGGEQLLETQNTSVSARTTGLRIPITPKSNLAPPQISTPRLRRYFPETLFWQPELVTDSKGHAQIKFPLADNITTWKLLLLASTETGEIGTAEKEIRAFQPFFVEHDPPRFLTAGDEIALPIVLRNYLSRNLQMNVEMKPENWFAALGPTAVNASVSAGDSSSEIFKFRATTPIREGKQRITASDGSAGAGDAIERAVTVRPNGEEKTESVSQVFDDAAALDLHIPAQALPGSIEGLLKIYPNLNAHVLKSIEAVLERPYGCAEQTISSTYPSILLLKYLKSAGQESSSLALKARRNIQLGYGQLLSYSAPDGGFTYWGKGDPDLAVSAYALKFLSDASQFVDIDDSIVNSGVTWLLKQAQPDGRWIARDWNGVENADRGAILTAYITRTIAGVKPNHTFSNSKGEIEVAVSAAVNLALEYLSPAAIEIDEPFLIASYALAIPKIDGDARFAESIARLRKLEHREGDTSYWSMETNTPFYGWGLAGRIETTALVLQALKRAEGIAGAETDRDMISRGLLFLLRNQDRHGIWYSSQATINVLETLEMLTIRNGNAADAAGKKLAGVSKAEILLDGRSILSVDVPSSSEIAAPVVVDISKFLSAGNHHVEIRRASGAATASVQAISEYYVPWADTVSETGALHQKKSSEALRLAIHFDKNSAKPGDTIECGVDAERIGFSGYGMMLAEIGLPPGAEVDRASLERAMAETAWGINQFEILPDRLIVYLWPHAGGTKFTFAFKPRYGLNALTAPSVLYDYYNPEAHAVVKPARFFVH